ncbi:MAG: DUF5050 domain-containing protein [Clostridiales bacterium]|nr:DUF5050 domain-containing protein [Clostridiales bacterium]
MKSRRISALLAVVLASGIVFSACGKSTGNSRSKKITTEDITSEEEDDTDDVLPEETGSEITEPMKEYFEPIDQHLSDIQKSMCTIPSKLDDGTEVPDCGRAPGQLGAGNANNGGFATGNEDYQFYVVHPQKHFAAIAMEDSKTLDEYYVYEITPQQDADNSIDSLILDGDQLYFRENSSVVKRLDLNDHSLTKVLEGDVRLLTLYQDMLYFAEEGSIKRTDLDGNNEEVLFETPTFEGAAHVPFCIAGTKIYYSEPVKMTEEGICYGKLCSMELDGSHKTELAVNAKVRNNDALMTDGERLYFDGRTPFDDGTEYAGPMSVLLDGSDLFIYHIPDEDAMFNYMDGTLYIFSNGRFSILDGLNHYQIAGVDDDEPGSTSAYGAVIVGKWFYVMTYNPSFQTGYVTERHHPEAEYIITLDRY